MLGDRRPVELAVRCTRRRREAGAAVLQVEDDVRRVGLPHPEVVLGAVGALAVTTRHNLFPLTGGRGARRRAGSVVRRVATVFSAVATARTDRPEKHRHCQRHRDGVPGHRRAEVDRAYAAYDEHPLDEPDAWGDLASFRTAAGSS
jgi:hypothetical protein